MKRLWIVALALSMLLSGCAVFSGGSYVNEVPHQILGRPDLNEDMQAQNYEQLYLSLANMAESGAKTGVIYIPRYDSGSIELDMETAVTSLTRDNPIAAYAVDYIRWEVNVNDGQRNILVHINYNHDRSEILKIRRASSMQQAEQMIYAEIADGDGGFVLYIENYQETDFVQRVNEYAFYYPNEIMEVPQVTVNVYPQSGSTRVVELDFQYQTSKDVLRSMKNIVRPIFDAAKVYVSGGGEARQKYEQLYWFLMNRHTYDIQMTSTPTYSLLCHGVGDSRAFATVYAAMCRISGLDCQTISGTRYGETWYWNVIHFGGAYYHVDLLRDDKTLGFQILTDEQMLGYTWDATENLG